MKIQNLDKIGILGLFLTVLASPCCFPLLGFLLSALGLGAFELFDGWTMWVLQALVLISLIGTFLSYQTHKNIIPLLVALVSAGLIAYAVNFDYNDKFIYIGMFGLLISAGLNYHINRQAKTSITCTVINAKTAELKSSITCPDCKYKKEEMMPTDACRWFYECENCKKIIKPKPGDCCVYCSYGTVKCPPIQMGTNCC